MVEGDGLENRCTLTGTEGSNPSLSAIYFLVREKEVKQEKCELCGGIHPSRFFMPQIGG